MSTWFGKYDYQGVVRDSNGFGSSGDNINDKRNLTMFDSLRTMVISGKRKTRNVTIDNNNNLQSVISHKMHLQLTKGQYAHFQDCSFTDLSNSIFSTYTQVLDPDPCDPQVVNTADFSGNFSNIDISNAYTGILLHTPLSLAILPGSCTIWDTSCDAFVYAEISNNTLDVSASVTLQGLELKKKMFAYPQPLNFLDICN